MKTQNDNEVSKALNPVPQCANDIEVVDEKYVDAESPILSEEHRKILNGYFDDLVSKKEQLNEVLEKVKKFNKSKENGNLKAKFPFRILIQEKSGDIDDENFEIIFSVNTPSLVEPYVTKIVTDIESLLTQFKEDISKI